MLCHDHRPRRVAFSPGRDQGGHAGSGTGPSASSRPRSRTPAIGRAGHTPAARSRTSSSKQTVTLAAHGASARGIHAGPVSATEPQPAAPLVARPRRAAKPLRFEPGVSVDGNGIRSGSDPLRHPRSHVGVEQQGLSRLQDQRPAHPGPRRRLGARHVSPLLGRRARPQEIRYVKDMNLNAIRFEGKTESGRFLEHVRSRRHHGHRRLVLLRFLGSSGASGRTSDYDIATAVVARPDPAHPQSSLPHHLLVRQRQSAPTPGRKETTSRSSRNSTGRTPPRLPPPQKAGPWASRPASG